MKYLSLLLALLLFNKAHSQVYSGKIDQYDIYLNLNHSLDDNGTIYAVTYFYKSQLKSIWLEGYITTDSVVLYKQYSEPEDVEELFSLQKQGLNLTGSWKNKETEFEVKLFPSQENLSSFKTEKFELLRDSISRFNDKELVWFTEKYSKTSLFRLGNGFSKEQRKYFNSLLDNLQFENAEMILDCQYVDIGINIKFLSNRYLSFEAYAEADCGGPHPNHGYKTFNFDLLKIKNLEKLQEIYPNLDFVLLLKEKYATDSNLMEECEYFDEGNTCWEYADWLIVKDGLEITPYFPHVLTPCRDSFKISNLEIEAFQKTQK